jgi:D-amino-acid dehydrogenase
MREYGCDRLVRSAAECLAIEPALGRATVGIVGGTYTAADESGDACKFTQRLAALAESRGVSCRFGATVAAIEASAGGIDTVRLGDGSRLEADAYVVALGSYTPQLLRPLGIRVPIYPAKGYSITLALEDGMAAPTVSLTDDGHKLVFSRLGNRLRVAGTAEFNGYDTSINVRRCEAIERRTFALFPDVAGAQTERWSGLRPSTPGNVPIIGRTRLANLFINSGHGTLGWTMACGSGRLLADLVSGRRPEIDAVAYQPR